MHHAFTSSNMHLTCDVGLYSILQSHASLLVPADVKHADKLLVQAACFT